MMATKKTTKSKVMTKKKTVKKTALKSSKNLDKQFASKVVFEEPDQKAKAKLSAKAKLIDGLTKKAMKKEIEDQLQDPDIIALESARPKKEIDISKKGNGYFSRDDAPVKKLTEKELEAAREELQKQRKPPSSVNYAKQAKRIKELIDSGIISINDLSVMTDYGVTQEAIELYKQQYTRTKSLEEELDEVEAEADDEYVCVDDEPSGNVETGFFSRSGSLVEQTVNTHPTAKELGEVYKLESDAGDYYAGKLAESLKLANTPVELKAAIKDIEDFEEKYVQAVKYHLKTKRNLIVMETHLKKIYAELKNDQA